MQKQVNQGGGKGYQPPQLTKGAAEIAPKGKQIGTNAAGKPIYAQPGAVAKPNNAIAITAPSSIEELRKTPEGEKIYSQHVGEINKHYHARQNEKLIIGEHLLELHKAISYGSWGIALKACNFPFSDDSAYRYMAAARAKNPDKWPLPEKPRKTRSDAGITKTQTEEEKRQSQIKPPNCYRFTCETKTVTTIEYDPEICPTIETIGSAIEDGEKDKAIDEHIKAMKAANPKKKIVVSISWSAV